MNNIFDMLGADLGQYQFQHQGQKPVQGHGYVPMQPQPMPEQPQHPVITSLIAMYGPQITRQLQAAQQRQMEEAMQQRQGMIGAGLQGGIDNTANAQIGAAFQPPTPGPGRDFYPY